MNETRFGEGVQIVPLLVKEVEDPPVEVLDVDSGEVLQLRRQPFVVPTGRKAEVEKGAGSGRLALRGKHSRRRARGFPADFPPIQDEGPLHPHPGQVIGHRAPHDPRAYNDDIRRFRHASPFHPGPDGIEQPPVQQDLPLAGGKVEDRLELPASGLVPHPEGLRVAKGFHSFPDFQPISPL